MKRLMPLRAGATLFALGRYAETRDVLASAVLRNQEHQEAHHHLANLLCHLGEHDRAIEVMRRAAYDIKPRRSGLHEGLGDLLVEAGKLSEAGAEFYLATTIDAMWQQTATIKLGHVRAAMQAPAQYRSGEGRLVGRRAGRFAARLSRPYERA